LKSSTAEQYRKKLFNAGFHVSRCQDNIEIVHGRAVHKESIQMSAAATKAVIKKKLETMTRSAEEISREEHIDLKVLVE
jgi:hypothetical protein